jgi:hypothetical protein
MHRPGNRPLWNRCLFLCHPDRSDLSRLAVEAERRDLRVTQNGRGKLLIALSLLSIFSTGFNTFPCEFVSIYIECVTLVENPQGRALSCNRTRSAPYAHRSTAQRSTPRGAHPRTTSRCMQAKHSWRLRSALEPLLLDGNLPPGMSNCKCGEP